MKVLRAKVIIFVIIIVPFMVSMEGQAEGTGSQEPELLYSPVEFLPALNSSSYFNTGKDSILSSLVPYLQSIETTCSDSDGGLNYEEAGFVSGIGPQGYNYQKDDVCETEEYEGYLKEFFCNGDVAWAARYQCPNGCADGACIPEPLICTDSDEDGFSVEGGECGPVDCDDSNPLVNPDQTEDCANGIDDDCNGAVDGDDLACIVCTDDDGDGYSQEGGACGAVDCDDADPLVNPDASEDCSNGIDDNCDGLIDDEDPLCIVCTDDDGDGYSQEGGACGAVDCDDTDPNVNPGVSEDCGNGIDDDCNGLADADEFVCSVPNIIVVGWDGTQRDHLLQCMNQELPDCDEGLPNLQSLSLFNITITSGDSATKPGWAQIYSGYNAEVMGIYSNGQYQPLPEGYSVFEKIEDHFGQDQVVTMFISGKNVNTGGACVGDPTTDKGKPVNEDQGQPWCLTKFHLDYYENDLRQNRKVGNRALELLELHSGDFFFASFIFRDPDVTGHLAGEDSSHYSKAIISDDYWLGEIMAKVEELGIADRTLIYVTTDHGFDEGQSTHGNAPYTFLATNDPLVIRSGDRRDLGPTFLERYGISLGAIGSAPPVNGHSLYSLPPLACVPEGEAYIDYAGSPACCTGLSLINLDRVFGNLLVPATGGTGDGSGYCTACGNSICTAPENELNCPADCS